MIHTGAPRAGKSVHPFLAKLRKPVCCGVLLRSVQRKLLIYLRASPVILEHTVRNPGSSGGRLERTGRAAQVAAIAIRSRERPLISMSMYSCPARPHCPSPEQPAFGDVGLLDERVAFDLVGELFRALFVYVGQYDPRALLHHRSAMARPIPAPAPVAMARFPSSRLTPYRPCVRAPLPLFVTPRIIAVWLGPRKRAARECCVPAKSYAPCTIGGATPIRGEHTVHPGRRPAAMEPILNGGHAVSQHVVVPAIGGFRVYYAGKGCENVWCQPSV
jgi:hypothetical protein